MINPTNNTEYSHATAEWGFSHDEGDVSKQNRTKPLYVSMKHFLLVGGIALAGILLVANSGFQESAPIRPIRRLGDDADSSLVSDLGFLDLKSEKDFLAHADFLDKDFTFWSMKRALACPAVKVETSLKGCDFQTLVQNALHANYDEESTRIEAACKNVANAFKDNFENKCGVKPDESAYKNGYWNHKFLYVSMFGETRNVKEVIAVMMKKLRSSSRNDNNVEEAKENNEDLTEKKLEEDMKKALMEISDKSMTKAAKTSDRKSDKICDTRMLNLMG